MEWSHITLRTDIDKDVNREALIEGTNLKPSDKCKEILEQLKINIPYLERLIIELHDEQFVRFLIIFKKLYINISFA